MVKFFIGYFLWLKRDLAKEKMKRVATIKVAALFLFRAGKINSLTSIHGILIYINFSSLDYSPPLLSRRIG